MKNPTLHRCLASLLSLILLACTAAFGQLTPTADAYTNTAATTTNYGAKTLLDVESTQTSFIQFNLASIPSTYTSADVTKATLKLYVNAVTTAGSFNVDYVNGTWTESTIDASNAPALGTTIAASVPLVTADKNQYILVDVTAAVQAWLSGTANDGIALVANSPLNASFDAKENTTTSHPAELDIVFAGGGTITGVTTASGSGLAGGGTSGTLNLSLTNGCAANQVLQYNGGSWVCAAVGTGTITGVTAGTDLTGGGTSGNVTLSLNTAATNALYAQLGAANAFTGQQTSTVATGDNPAIYGNQTGAGIGVVGQTVNVFGVAGSETGTTGQPVGVFGQAVAPAGYGVEGTNFAQTGNAVGVYGTSSSSTGYGVVGSNTATSGVNTGVSGTTASTSGTGVQGASNATTGTTYGVTGAALSTAGIGVFGFEVAPTGSTIGVLGETSSSAGFGVEGVSSYIGVAGSVDSATASAAGLPYGVLGSSSTVGVYGASSGVSNTGEEANLIHAAGVWGDFGGARSGIGVLGTADTYWGGAFNNNSPTNPALYAENDTTIAGGEVFEASMTKLLGADAFAIIGDAGCGSGFMALQLGQNGMSGCNNYLLMGDASGNTYLNAGAGDFISFRIANGHTQMTITNDNVDVLGTLTKPAGSFKIDDPLDPANKYLYHSFVESPDMKNMYDGTITTDDAGLATVTLPAWFETLNRDFRYQLTVIGQFAQAIVASKVANNHFSIKTDKPNVEVSWQVTGTRQDAYANAHRIQVEVEKAPADRGHYLYPELVGAPDTARIGYMASAPGTEQVARHQRPSLHSGSGSPAQRVTLHAPPKRVLPNIAPSPRVAPLPPITPLSHPAQASKPEVNQK